MRGSAKRGRARCRGMPAKDTRKGPLPTEVAMMRRQIPAGFDEIDQSPESDRGVTAAWIIVILLLVATSVGLLLDHAATITP